MSFIDSSSSTIQATLTRRGRELLATDSSKFNITKFAFGDDEIDYSLYDGSSPDAANTDILSLPVIEPSSENISPLRWGLVTALQNTTNVADIEVPKHDLIFVAGSVNVLVVRTLRGYDSQYYVSSQDREIVTPIKDIFDSVADTTKFDVFQKQSKADLIFNVLGAPGDSTIITIKGNNTAVTKILKVNIVLTK